MAVLTDYSYLGAANGWGQVACLGRLSWNSWVRLTTSQCATSTSSSNKMMIDHLEHDGMDKGFGLSLSYRLDRPQRPARCEHCTH